GGNPPIAYNWINLGVANTTTVASSLCADTYFIQMTDAEGCVRTASVLIDVASSLSLNVVSSHPACSANDGSISVTPSGGTPPYNVSWQPGGSTGSSLTNLAAGSYTVIVSDQNGAGCSQMQVINLSNPSGPQAIPSQTNPSCFGACS